MYAILVSTETGFDSIEQQKELKEKLEQTSELLHDLSKVQQQRLSEKPPSHLSLVRPPSQQEQETGKQNISSTGDIFKVHSNVETLVFPITCTWEHGQTSSKK